MEFSCIRRGFELMKKFVVACFQAPEDLRDAFPTGKGFRLSHNGTQDMIFYAETEANAEKWIAAILNAVAFK